MQCKRLKKRKSSAGGNAENHGDRHAAHRPPETFSPVKRLFSDLFLNKRIFFLFVF